MTGRRLANAWAWGVVMGAVAGVVAYRAAELAAEDRAIRAELAGAGARIRAAIGAPL